MLDKLEGVKMPLRTSHTGEAPAIDQTLSTNRLDSGRKRDGTRKPGKRYGYVAQILLTSTPLLAADLLGLVSAFMLSFFLMSAFLQYVGPNLSLMLPLTSGVFLLINAMLGLYPGIGIDPIMELRQCTIAITSLFAVFFVASLAYGDQKTLTLFLGVAYLQAILLIPLMRSVARSFCSRFNWWGQPTLIFGEGALAQRSYTFLASHRRFGLRPVGIVGDNEHLLESAHLWPMSAGRTIASRLSIFCAVVAMPRDSQMDVGSALARYTSGIPLVLIVSDIDDFPSLWKRTEDWNGLLTITIEKKLLLPLPRLAKRIVDLAIVICVALCILPVIALIALLIKIDSPGAVIFGHERIGQGGRRFRAWKFRTMVNDAGNVLQKHLDKDPKLREEWGKNQKIKKDPRVTRIGRWLRRCSLDELPQLWNILLGEMSLVGPRPIVESEISRYGKNYELYTKVVPGLSGLWQISGRNNTTYAERVRLDSYYVRNWSPFMDIYILARTVRIVLLGDGAY